MVAGAIYKAIKNLTLIDIDIKWVNDIYYRYKKIGGILTEAITSIETGLVTDVIIGVGFNLAIPAFPEELESKAGSLFEGLVPSPAMTSSARFGRNSSKRMSMNWSTSIKSAPWS